MNCFDDCKYYYDSYIDNGSCELKPDFKIPDNDTFSCSDYIKAKNCLTCKHSSPTIYETGTIDWIEYRCNFEGNATWTDKVVYDDSEPMTYHHYDIPECPNGNWEGDDT